MSNKLLVFSLVFCFALFSVGCKSKKKAATNAEIGALLENMPCEKDGKSDKEFFRAASMANSSNLQLSKEKALLAAKQRLITLINSTTKSVTDRYVNERSVTGASEFEEKFENLTREVADETINNLVVICEQSSVLPDKQYRTFIAIQVSKADLEKGFSNRVSKDQKLQLDYDKKKFAEIFDEEMAKMAAEKGY